MKFDLPLAINLTKDILVKYFMVFNRYFKLQFNVIVLQHVNGNYGLKTVTKTSPCHFAYNSPKCCDLVFVFGPAHAHLIWTCACASNFACACAPHLDLRKRIPFGTTHAHINWACACASHFGLCMSISFGPAHAYLN